MHLFEWFYIFELISVFLKVDLDDIGSLSFAF